MQDKLQERELSFRLVVAAFPGLSRDEIEQRADELASARVALHELKRKTLQRAEAYARALEVYDGDDDDCLTEATFDAFCEAALGMVEQQRVVADLSGFRRPSKQVQPARSATSPPSDAATAGG